MSLSREEMDSMRALAATSEETAKLANTLYKAVLANPGEAKKRSRNGLRTLQLPAVATEVVEVMPLRVKVSGGR